jgi:pilus assembly protein CpaB
MRGKSLALLALALGCGLVASLGITQVMAKRNDPVADMETVLVAAKDIPTGGQITAPMLKLEQRPKEQVSPGALNRIEDVEGRRARAELFAGDIILEQKLLGKDATGRGADALVPKGYRVVSVRVDAVSGGAGLLLPGSRVDLLVHVTRNPALGFQQTTTKTVLQDLKVFAVNDVVSVDPNGPETKSIAARTVSLLVTPAQAEKITLASELGVIRLVMRGIEEETQSVTRGSTPSELFGTVEAGRRDKDSLMQQEPVAASKQQDGLLAALNSMRKASIVDNGDLPITAPPAEKPKWGFRMLKGNEVVDLELEGNETASAAGKVVSLWKVVGSAAKPKAGIPSQPAGWGKLDPADELRAAGSEPKAAKPAKEELSPTKVGLLPGKDESKPGKDERKSTDSSRKN